MPGASSLLCEGSGSVVSAEVTEINKQKFLAELEKLLAFMYEEDRQMALAMYGRIFDDAESEQAVLQKLFSPTRQAINVARVYNAKERKLQVEAQSRGDSAQQDVSPAFLLEINKGGLSTALKIPLVIPKSAVFFGFQLCRFFGI